MLNSRCGFRHPSILVNSIPKSGTHLAKAILEGAGNTFVGHVGDTEKRLFTVSPVSNKYFVTSHITRPITDDCKKLLVFRNPVDVAVSMAVYIQARSDHPRNKLFLKMTLEESVKFIFSGGDDLEPLANRYAAMLDWSKASNARAIDFGDFKRNPNNLLDAVGVNDFSPNAVQNSVMKWNPTKRTKRAIGEQKIKEHYYCSKIQAVRNAFDVYKEIKSLI